MKILPLPSSFFLKKINIRVYSYTSIDYGSFQQLIFNASKYRDDSDWNSDCSRRANFRPLTTTPPSWRKQGNALFHYFPGFSFRPGIHLTHAALNDAVTHQGSPSLYVT
jgi:hypothetical protein